MDTFTASLPPSSLAWPFHSKSFYIQVKTTTRCPSWLVAIVKCYCLLEYLSNAYLIYLNLILFQFPQLINITKRHLTHIDYDHYLSELLQSQAFWVLSWHPSICFLLDWILVYAVPRYSCPLYAVQLSFVIVLSGVAHLWQMGYIMTFSVKTINCSFRFCYPYGDEPI